jgi:2-isopropylmalate synthase
MADQVIIFDTTLRDGEQSPGISLDVGEKLEIAEQLARLGVDVIEAGFPVASQGDFEATQAIARAVRGPVICGLSRTAAADVDRCWEAIQDADRPRIHIFLATSETHMKHKLRMTAEQVKIEAARAVAQAKAYTPDVEFSPEDASRSDFDFMCEVLQIAVDNGATTLNIPDTVGFAVPEEYAARLAKVREVVTGDYVISAHCHDDLGMAVANSLAGIQGGARQVECTINGVGERAGNAALEEIAAALMVRHDRFPYTSNIKLDKLFPTSQMLAECISFGAAPNKAVVGANAFAHESGIHQHGMLANPLTYEIMTPASVGAGNTNLVLGKHSGRRALADRLEKLGHSLTREQLDEVYHRFTELADRKKSIYDQDILGLLKPEKATVAAAT